jgi:hypothetical protein
MTILTKKWVGPYFGRCCNKLIWSPWRLATKKVSATYDNVKRVQICVVQQNNCVFLNIVVAKINEQKMPSAKWEQQGCQMVCFQTKNIYSGNFWRALRCNMLVYFWTFGLFYGHLIYFVAIRYILCKFGKNFSRFGTLCQEKSGNPGEQDYFPFFRCNEYFT